MEWLDEIKARLAAATPGPWRTDHQAISTSNPRVLVGDGAVIAFVVESSRNCHLIANAPADLSRLIAEVERLDNATMVADREGRAHHNLVNDGETVVATEVFEQMRAELGRLTRERDKARAALSDLWLTLKQTLMATAHGDVSSMFVPCNCDACRSADEVLCRYEQLAVKEGSRSHDRAV